MITIESRIVCEDIKLGGSISINGTCLTVTSVTNSKFKVEATQQTNEITNISKWHSGKKVNLERAMKAGDRFGGHIVQGHVDGLGKIAKIGYMAGSNEYYIEAPQNIRDLIVDKGSITIDGVSLTIAGRTKLGFSLMLIPFTLKNTTLGLLRPGDEVNIETDIIIRWLAEKYHQEIQKYRTDTWEQTFSQINSIHKEE